MSRLQRLAHSVASGYVVLAMAALYSLASVPLALQYLSKERFALWALMTSLGGYLSLIDLGMSGSIARVLVDYKDKKEDSAYGSLIKTGWLVLGVQGVIILIAGLPLAGFFARLLAIPVALEAEFIVLLRWQCVVLAIGFVVRIFSHLLSAHQRQDVVNYVQLATMFPTFALLWWLFYRGHGVFSLVWVGLAGALFNAGLLLLWCVRLRLFPVAGAWGHLNWQYFKELFDYGKDLFLVAVGSQLIIASQTMIITRMLGLELAAVWAIGTKVFTLLSQLIWRITDFALPAFAEMMVRGEVARLRERYQALVVLTASLAGLAAVSYALCNSLFVSVWTQGKIHWPASYDLLLGFWMVLLALLHCHNCFVLTTKRIGFMRYVFFVEGAIFVVVALVVARAGGLAAIITSSILCSVAFSGAYGVWRISRYFSVPVRVVAVSWLAPMVRVLLIFAPVALVAWWSLAAFSNLTRLIAYLILCGSFGLYVFLRHGVSASFQGELLARSPSFINPLLRRVFLSSTS